MLRLAAGGEGRGGSELVQRQRVEISKGMMDRLSFDDDDDGCEEDYKEEDVTISCSECCKRVITCP